MEQIYYIIESSFYRDNSNYTPAKLTGRWKIVRDETGTRPILYLEHKGRFFKKWVDESDFFLGNKREEYINTCESSFHKFGQSHIHCHIKK